MSSVLLHKSSQYMYYNCRFWYNRVWSTYLVFLSSQKYDFPIEKVQNLDFEGQYLGNGAKWTSKKLLLIMCNSSNWALLETQKKFHWVRVGTKKIKKSAFWMGRSSMGNLPGSTRLQFSPKIGHRCWLNPLKPMPKSVWGRWNLRAAHRFFHPFLPILDGVVVNGWSSLLVPWTVFFS